MIDAAAAEIKAAGGNEYALAINNTGTVRATGVVNQGGRILLTANAGKVRNAGTLTTRRVGAVRIAPRPSFPTPPPLPSRMTPACSVR